MARQELIKLMFTGACCGISAPPSIPVPTNTSALQNQLKCWDLMKKNQSRDQKKYSFFSRPPFLKVKCSGSPSTAGPGKFTEQRGKCKYLSWRSEEQDHGTGDNIPSQTPKMRFKQQNHFVWVIKSRKHCCYHYQELRTVSFYCLKEQSASQVPLLFILHALGHNFTFTGQWQQTPQYEKQFSECRIHPTD